MTSALLPPARRKLWPKSLAGKAAAVFAVSLILLALTWFVALFVTERRLATAMKRAETEFGFSNNIDDFIPAILPPERNAMIPLDEAAALVTPGMTVLPFWDWNQDAESRLKAFPTLATTLRIEAVDRLLDDADRRPECSPTTSPLRPFLRNGGAPHRPRRLLVESEALVGWMLVKDGRTDDGVRRLLRILRLGRKWTAVEPYFGDVVNDVSRRNHVLNALNLILRTAKIDPVLHGEIGRELAEQAKCRDIVPRLYHIEKLKRLKDFEVYPERQRAWWLVGPLAANDRLLIVNWYDRIIRDSQRPYSEVHNDLKLASDELWRISKHPVDRLLHPDVLSVTSEEQRRGFDYLCATARCLRIINAMAKQQRWDAELDSLGLPEDALIDPINEGRLLVKRTPTGPIIYSVGFDLVDDGGTFDAKTLIGMDIGLAPPTK
jgi:hypothetical protein